MRTRTMVLTAVTVSLVGGLACDSGEQRPTRRRAAKADDRTDTSLPMDVRVAFEPPPSWERVVLPAGLEFQQPRNFTVVNAPALTCDASTAPADQPVLQTALFNRWPLTLAMRRGDLAQIARANGFTIDSTDIAAHGQQPGDTTVVRRGEGWMLLSGRTKPPVLFASVRAPNGCYLVWAARGIEINADTLGLVLGTIRYGPAPADSM